MQPPQAPVHARGCLFVRNTRDRSELCAQKGQLVTVLLAAVQLACCTNALPCDEKCRQVDGVQLCIGVRHNRYGLALESRATPPQFHVGESFPEGALGA